jgi:hypothetical protein
MACIMNGVTKKQRLTKQNPLKVFYYNKIIEVKTLLSVKKITKQSKQNSYTSLEIIFLNTSFCKRGCNSTLFLL